MDRVRDKMEKAAALPAFPLALAGEGETVKIVSMRRCRRFRERLLSMGIQVDDVIRVLQRRAQGAVVVSKAQGRYALGGGMALKIQVTREV